MWVGGSASEAGNHSHRCEVRGGEVRVVNFARDLVAVLADNIMLCMESMASMLLAVEAMIA